MQELLAFLIGICIGKVLYLIIKDMLDPSDE